MSGEAIEPEQADEVVAVRSRDGNQEPAGATASLQRVILAAGGTAGHLYPGVALAEAIRERNPHAQILFVGTKRGVETNVVPQLGYPLRLLRSTPYYGASAFSRFKGVFELSYGVLQARALIKEYRPQVVVGFGGFTSIPAVVAAASLGVPTAIHESNVSPGVATNLLARVANEVYVGFQDCARAIHGSAIFTGNPVRPEIAALSSVRRLPTGGRTVRLLVATGSMGEGFFNQRVPAMVAALEALGNRVEVWQQAGQQVPLVSAAYKQLGLRARVDTFIEDMPSALRWADVVVSRAGASMLAEVAAAGLPAVIVPLVGHARNHQAENAAAYARAGAGWFVPEHSWEPERVAGLVHERLAQPDLMRRISRSARQFVNPEAAQDIVRRLERLALAGPARRGVNFSGSRLSRAL